MFRRLSNETVVHGRIKGSACMKVCDLLRFSFYRHLESSRRLKASQGQEVCARFNLKVLCEQTGMISPSVTSLSWSFTCLFIFPSQHTHTHSSTVWIHVGAQMSLPDWTCTHTHIYIYICNVCVCVVFYVYP